MQLFKLTLLLSLTLAPAATRAEIDPELEAKWGTDWPFSGITTFAHLGPKSV